MMENVVPVVVIVVLIYLITEGIVSVAKHFGRTEIQGKAAVIAAAIVGAFVVVVSFYVSTLPPADREMAKNALILFGSILGSYGLNDTIKGLMPPGKPNV
jgi:hypothetical protein